MFNSSVRFVLLAGVLALCILRPETSLSQLIDRVSSDHVVMRMPKARESLGRDTIREIEQCYVFMNRATGGKMPRKILIDVDWNQSESTCNKRDGSITVGMDRPDKNADLRALLLHRAGREIARLGLLEISGWAQREDTEFLFEGMIEILIHEFSHSSRSLESAWTYCQLLDQTQALGFNTQRYWSIFSAGKRSHRSAAPGITFLTTFRELQGRDRPIKLFEALKKASLSASLADTFKSSVAEVEAVWLKKVREHPSAEEITIFEEDAPKLMQTGYAPVKGESGNEILIQMLFGDRDGDLLADGVFLKDQRTQSIVQAQESPENEREYIVAKIPVAADCPPGQYNYEVIAIDEGGNLRRWTRSYEVDSR